MLSLDYPELHRLAARLMAGERAGHTLSAIELQSTPSKTGSSGDPIAFKRGFTIIRDLQSELETLQVPAIAPWAGASLTTH